MKMHKRGCLTAFAIYAAVLAACGSCLGAVVINEVELNPVVGAHKWVELYNSGDESVDLSGWTAVIKDGPWEGPMTVPAGTSIDSKGYYVIEGDSRWEDRFNASVILVDSSGNIVDETPLFSDMDGNDFTQSRIPNGKDTNTSRDWAFVMSSKGRPNGGSVISS